MSKKEELCLRMRNTTRDEETYCKHYTKKFSGYARSVFINYATVGLFLGSAALLVMCLLTPDDWLEFATYIKWVLFGAFALGYLGKIIIGLWFWKYSKHVVVTNEGVWVMYYSAFWWSEDFTGKTKLLSPCWSLYSWEEIKITDDDSVRPKTSIKLEKLFDGFDYAVIKSSGLSSLFMTRWDGIEEIHFLEKSDAEEILAYARERKKGKRRKKKDAEIIEKAYDELPDDEYETDDVD